MPAKKVNLNPNDPNLDNFRHTLQAVVPLPKPINDIKLSNLPAGKSLPELLGLDKLKVLGKGQLIAVIDTGISQEADLHKDLKGKVVAWYNYLGENNSSDPKADLYDVYGHGTHMAGIIAGDRIAGKIVGGIAPEAKLISIKITDEGKCICPVWHIIEALKVVKRFNENKPKMPISIVNLSFNLYDNCPDSNMIRFHELYQLLRELHENNVAVVVSGGNCFGFFESYGLGYPAYCEYVFAAGAARPAGRSYRIVNNAQRIPAQEVLNFNIPFFIFIQGVETTSTGFSDNYNQLISSSQSAAVVSGILALIRCKYGTLSVNRLKKILHFHGTRFRNQVPLTGAAGPSTTKYLMANAFKSIDSPTP